MLHCVGHRSPEQIYKFLAAYSSVSFSCTSICHKSRCVKIFP